MIALVTGASGILGRAVSRELVDRAHSVRGLTRSTDSRLADGVTRVVGDLAGGAALRDAVDGVDVVFHCATDSRRHREVDVRGTERLIETATHTGRPAIVYPGIVGSDVIPLRYYRSKIEAENAISSSPLDWIVLRATQFHHLVWWALGRLARPPLMLVPHDTRFQPIDPRSVARLMIEASESGRGGRLDDVGGPTAYSSKDLARSHLAATGSAKRVLQLNVPGIVGASFRAGANLTPNRDTTGATWNDFVAEATGRT